MIEKFCCDLPFSLPYYICAKSSGSPPRKLRTTSGFDYLCGHTSLLHNPNCNLRYLLLRLASVQPSCLGGLCIGCHTCLLVSSGARTKKMLTKQPCWFDSVGTTLHGCRTVFRPHPFLLAASKVYAVVVRFRRNRWLCVSEYFLSI